MNVSVPAPPTDIDLAAWDLLEAKRLEEEARQRRLEVEARLIELIGVKEEGTTSKKTAYFKASTTGGLTRTLVQDWEDVFAQLPDWVTDTAIRYKYEVSVSGLKQLATSNPDIYAKCLKAIVTKPAKPAVKVELLEQVPA